MANQGPALGGTGGNGPRTKWFVEIVTPALLQVSSVVRTVYSGQTRFQQVEVLDTEPFGRILVLDGKTQSSEADERIYHEALVHPAMLAHPDPRRVFIGGGGEGATLREVLSHRSVQRAVMVDLDEEVVKLCVEHLPQWHQGAFHDSRAEVRHEDAYAYLQNSREPFDVLVLDLVDPMETGPAYKLYTREFYTLCKERLTDRGTLVVQSGPAIAGISRGISLGETPEGALVDTPRAFPAIANTLRGVFPTIACYSAIIPAFGSAWSFIVASKGSDNPANWDPAELDRRIASRIKGAMYYYDGATHRGMFALPKPLRQALERETWVITEQHPLYVP